MKQMVKYIALLLTIVVSFTACKVTDNQDPETKIGQAILVYEHSTKNIISQFQSSLNVALKIDEIYTELDADKKTDLIDKYFPHSKVTSKAGVFTIVSFNIFDVMVIETGGTSIHGDNAHWIVYNGAFKNKKLAHIKRITSNLFNVTGEKIELPNYNISTDLQASCNLSIAVSPVDKVSAESSSIYKYSISGGGEYSEVSQIYTPFNAELVHNTVAYSFKDNTLSYCLSDNDTHKSTFIFSSGAIDMTVIGKNIQDGLQDIKVEFKESVGPHTVSTITYKGVAESYITE